MENVDIRKDIRFYLHNIDSLKIELINIRETIKALETVNSLEMQITSHLSDMPNMPNSNNNGSQLENIAIKNVEAIKKLQRDLHIKTIKIFVITKIISYLRGNELTIIQKKYLNKEVGRKPPTYSEIGITMNLDMDHVQKIEGSVISKIQKEIKKYL